MFYLIRKIVITKLCSLVQWYGAGNLPRGKYSHSHLVPKTNKNGYLKFMFLYLLS